MRRHSSLQSLFLPDRSATSCGKFPLDEGVPPHLLAVLCSGVELAYPELNAGEFATAAHEGVVKIAHVLRIGLTARSVLPARGKLNGDRLRLTPTGRALQGTTAFSSAQCDHRSKP